MKYLTFLTASVLSLHSAHSAESGVRGLQEDDVGFREGIRGFLNNTLNAVQTIEIPTLPGFGEDGFMTVLTCDAETLESAQCNLLSGVTGVNVCRPLGGVNVTVCAPKILGNYIGSPSDTCGCCGGECYTKRTTCRCSCQEGRGVMVNHNILKILGRQVSWKACYTPTIAAQVMDSRPEFECWDGCDAEEMEEPEIEGEIEEDEANEVDSNATLTVPSF